MKQKIQELTFVAISGINFPYESREYLMNLIPEIVARHNAKIIKILGGTVNGKKLEKELKARIAYQKAALKAAAQQSGARYGRDEDFTFDQAAVEQDFVDNMAEELSQFLPKIEGVNYHIIVAEKVFDRQIGVRILKELRKLRSDVRLLGEKDDGSFDTEVKFPVVELRDFDIIRGIVPSRQPWHSQIITTLMQRLIRSFTSRTFSDKPSLTLVGSTGTAAYLPYFENMPCVSVPALHKLDEQYSSENMVGCIVGQIITQKGKLPRVIIRTYDFRPLVSREREMSIPKNAPALERAVLNALKISSASFSTVLYRVQSQASNGQRKRWNEEKVHEKLQELKERGAIVYRKDSNRYSVNEQRIGMIDITLEDLFANSRTVSIAGRSCLHIGALKTLYFTMLEHFPQRAAEFDNEVVLIDNGDISQGVSHGYEYNGEILATLNGPDKHEIAAGRINARILLNITRVFMQAIGEKKNTYTLETLLRKCFPRYCFNSGNHDGWIYHNKGTLILELYERTLRAELISGIFRLCRAEKVALPEDAYFTVTKVLDEKITRVGENGFVSVNGILIGVKHPHKGRTQNKSHRIQDVVQFFWSITNQIAAHLGKNDVAERFAVAHVANFHEAASVHAVKFGNTAFGLMTGAFVKDTSFEHNLDKVVDYGFVLARATVNAEGALLLTEVEYDNTIVPKDAEFVFADKITTEMILERSRQIEDLVGPMPWRNA